MTKWKPEIEKNEKGEITSLFYGPVCYMPPKRHGFTAHTLVKANDEVCILEGTKDGVPSRMEMHPLNWDLVSDLFYGLVPHVEITPL